MLRIRRARTEHLAPFISIFLLFGAAPAVAAPLWQNVDSGMSVKQLQTMYPQGGTVSYSKDEVLLHDYRMTPDCPADVHIHLASGIVRSVEIRGSGSLNRRCSDTVLNALSAKYGEALRVPDTAHIVYRWNRPALSVQFARWPPDNLANLFHSWTVTYQPAQQLPL